MTKGREKVVELVEQAYFAGNDHLLDVDFKKKMLKQSFCLSNCFILFMLVITAFFFYFTIENFYEQ